MKPYICLFYFAKCGFCIKNIFRIFYNILLLQALFTLKGDNKFCARRARFGGYGPDLRDICGLRNIFYIQNKRILLKNTIKYDKLQTHIGNISK